ncbi:hypothetical protein [Alteribacter populi]|uniref:hypothetical protein n=1 Tax=Alteribacter populi TaxID=2011011 RepID=UPI000BBAEAE1|nr:hypothetical protein [Alteribacter populi]
MPEENTNETTEQQTDQTATSGEEQQTDTATEKAEEKTFKQDDVNNIVAKESKKATEKLLKELGIDDFENAKDGMTKFKEWQESQKTEAEKQQEQLDSLTSEKDSLSSENNHLKSQISAMKAGVKGESVEDVIALAERRVNDDVSIDDAIEQVVKEYPHFAGEKGEENQNSPRIVTGGNPNGGENTPDDPFSAKLAKYK